MEYLVRFVQVHESFRRAELEALATLAIIDLKILHYNETSPFCVVRLANEAAARALAKRAILCQGIYELWASGTDYNSLHKDLECNNAIDPSKYRHASFRFDIDCFQGKHSPSSQRELIESFAYLPLDGAIKMSDPDFSMCIFEEYETHTTKVPRKLYLGRWVTGSNRSAVDKYSLKKRNYISRTSMDAELSLVTANLTLAAPGKIIYDPFVGTGSFSVAVAHFGASAIGSDLDGRSIRGTAKDRNLYSNFMQYQTTGLFFDSFIADLTHTPLRQVQLFDGIICDPPYGVREGPKVLGQRHKLITEPVMIDGIPAHLRDGYIPPRKPYAFDDMLADVLDFSFLMLVENGRLSMWMPTANDEDVELAVPVHPGLEIVSVCVQQFNKWARRLLTYRRLPDASVQNSHVVQRVERVKGATADDLNRFRKKYFTGFKPEEVTPTLPA